MLQVHNEMTRERELRDEYKKSLQKLIAEERKKKANADDVRIGELQTLLAAHEEGAAIPQSPDDPALPGYLLLIDEPENALHPMAARAAQRHLYKLAESADWQVMMTTHSPYFVNPLEDHTTIVRLERKEGNDSSPIEPKTYRSDSIQFEGDDKKRLQALQHIDPSLAEIFFGSYPVLVEGDTEHAAFLASIVEAQHRLMEQVTIVRARGKAILVALISIMRHFKIDFGVVHDCDPPYTSEGNANGMWTQNGRIHDAIIAARADGVKVRHRVSIPDFERFLGGSEESKDKPLNTYRRVADDELLAERVQVLLGDLLESEQHEPFPETKLPPNADYLFTLKELVSTWAADNGMLSSLRYKGKDG
ncbi:ATP-dependent nuclease [Stenotrophomonas maltophilia]|uniref:ATP-dependent nuclease n=1 Tax=Stenotrophomonas maltophilia TaxID=40324 RepID=UPI001B7D7841|nr:ATP-dependent endonuclease [Stenotrophomonas maltophilia]